MDPCLFPEAPISLWRTPRPPAVIDVGKRPAFEADPVVLPGAVWHSQAVEPWAAKLPPGWSLAVSCVHGHEASRGARDASRRRGVTAGITGGGIEGWRAAGGPVVAAQGGDGR